MPRKLPEKMKETQFKPGRSGNPKGRPVMTEGQRELRKLTLKSYQGVIETVLTGSIEDLKRIAQDPKSTALEVGIATAFMQAIKTGDYVIIERIAERIVGKMPETINLNTVSLSVPLDPNDPQVKAAVAATLAQLEADV